MDLETIKLVLNTRLKIARDNGNSTESSLLISLLEMSEELGELRKNVSSEGNR